MAWRDRLRRRTAGPDTADRSRGAERAGSDGPSGDGQDRGASGGPAPSRGPVSSGGPAPSVPGDWDGGWRRTPPPQLTVARAPLGVSDGLAFRDGLAAWQNPSFDAGLGHALLPTAPTGLVRGVTPPAAAQPTRTGRGPLLLRALRTQEPNSAESATPQAVAPNPGSTDAGTRTPTARTPQVSRRTRPGAASSTGTGTVGTGSGPAPAAARPGGDSTARGRRSGGTPRSGRGITSADSPATLLPPDPPVQRAADPATGPVVTPTDAGTGRVASAPHIPLVRRVSVVPGTAAAPARPATGGHAPRTPSGASEPHQVRGSRPTAGSASRTSSGPAVQRSTTGTPGSRPERGGGASAASLAPEAPRAPRVEGVAGSPKAVRVRAVGPLPTVARRPAGPVRRLPALHPATVRAPEGRATPDAPGPDTTAPASAGAGTLPAAPVQRAASRAPLGAPMTELPSTATPLAADDKAVPPAARTASSPGPALPVVQHHSEPTAGVPAPGTPSAPTKRAEAPERTTSDRTTSDRTTSDRTAPGRRTGARARGGLGAPLSELPPTAGLPGATGSGARPPRTVPGPDIQRAPAGQDRRSGATPAHPTADGNRGRAKDAPLLGASAGDTGRPDTPSGGSGPGTSGSGSLGSGRQRPGDSGPAAPAPVVVARAPAPGNASTAGTTTAAGGLSTTSSASTTSTSGTASTTGTPRTTNTTETTSTTETPRTTSTPTTSTVGPHPITVARAGAHAAPAPPRTLSLLAARPLGLSTQAPEGVAAPVAARPTGRPVVAARWPGVPAPQRSGSAPPSRGPSATAPGTPQVQRAATGRSGARTGSAGRGVRSNGAPESVQRVPVVRPAPLARGASGEPVPAGPVPASTVQTSVVQASAAPGGRPVSVRPLPVTAPQAQALAGRPPGTPAPARAPAGTVPVVRPRSTRPTGSAPPVQRDVTGAGDGSVPNGSVSNGSAAKGPLPDAAPAKAESQRSATTSSATGSGAAGHAGSPQGSGADMDELARRLLDPVARLLRTELRRGRDRTGRPYDGRR
ncbi:hypothetical protein ACFYWO_12990 [Streptomyces sp. NPDC002932]|uniref:hypothetical protein n=1 Tax=Streptomyces sp. NPDC002932 TaxID=3364672 RepID=UPI0036CDF56B